MMLNSKIKKFIFFSDNKKIYNTFQELRGYNLKTHYPPYHSHPPPPLKNIPIIKPSNRPDMIKIMQDYTIKPCIIQVNSSISEQQSCILLRDVILIDLFSFMTKKQHIQSLLLNFFLSLSLLLFSFILIRTISYYVC